MFNAKFNDDGHGNLKFFIVKKKVTEKNQSSVVISTYNANLWNQNTVVVVSFFLMFQDFWLI